MPPPASLEVDMGYWVKAKGRYLLRDGKKMSDPCYTVNPDKAVYFENLSKEQIKSDSALVLVDLPPPVEPKISQEAATKPDPVVVETKRARRKRKSKR